MNSLKSTYFLAAVAVAVLAVALPSACGPAKTCSSSNCTGCCDADGTCQNGNSNTSCGSSGTLCKACSSFDVCQLGFCAPFGGGGSGGASGGGTGGSGGGSGGGVANTCAATCSGCCTPGGTCIYPATSSTACGAGGATCQACTASQSCSGGLCRSSSCSGCVDTTNACQSGTSSSACGSGGVSCTACNGGDTCSASGFCTGGACGGCRDTNGVCQSGTTRGACGTGGGFCTNCPTGFQCSNGACVTGTGGGSGGGSTGGGTGGSTGGGTGGGSTGGGGTLVGYLNNLNPSCASTGSADHVYSFTVSGTQLLNVTVESGGSFTPALAVYSGSGCGTERACNSGPAANITNLTVTSGTYYLVVDLSAGTPGPYYLSATLSPAPPDAGTFTSTPLQNNVAVSVSGAMGIWTYYSVNVVSSSQLHVTTIADAGTGDADLYMDLGTQPTNTSQWSSTAVPPAGEDILVTSPQPGTYYIGVYGYSDYTGQILRATW